MKWKVSNKLYGVYFDDTLMISFVSHCGQMNKELALDWRRGYLDRNAGYPIEDNVRVYEIEIKRKRKVKI